jgi:two-component system cell cycle response regulator CtrA
MRENVMLRERVAALEAELIEARPLPIEWQLTAQECRVFGTLVNRELATKSAIMTALYHDRDDEAEEKIVDVFICKIRKKLKRFNIEIKTVWGQGYCLPAAERARYRRGGEQRAAA